jgi:FkbM family methyltransferase
MFRLPDPLINLTGLLSRRGILRPRRLLLPLLGFNGADRVAHDFSIALFEANYVGNLRFGLDYHAFFFGPFERGVLKLFADVAHFAKNSRLHDRYDSVALDIGANVGHHALFLSGLFTRVLAFEPYPDVMTSLSAKARANQRRGIEIYPVGLDFIDRTLDYFAPATLNTASGSFIAGCQWNTTSGTPLQLRAGDEFLAGIGAGRPMLIKIDVEGYEPQVLKGLASTLRQARPVVVFERSAETAASAQRLDTTIAALFPSDYQFCNVVETRRRGAYRLTLTDPDASDAGPNVLALPEEFSAFAPAD